MVHFNMLSKRKMCIHLIHKTELALALKSQEIKWAYSLIVAPMLNVEAMLSGGPCQLVNRLCKAWLPQGLKPSWLGFHLRHKACQSTTAQTGDSVLGE